MRFRVVRLISQSSKALANKLRSMVSFVLYYLVTIKVEAKITNEIKKVVKEAIVGEIELRGFHKMRMAKL